MKKPTILLLTCLVIAMLIIPTSTWASSAPGSSGDPLVTQGWVDDYVEQQFAIIQSKVKNLRNDVLKYLGLNEVDIQLFIGNNTAKVYNISKKIDPERPAVVPQLKTDSKGGYTMVPIRFVAESMGVMVEWQNDTRQVIFSDGTSKVALTVDSLYAQVDGQDYSMGYAPFIENQRTYVHVRFVAEAFDCYVGWLQSEKKVTVTR